MTRTFESTLLAQTLAFDRSIFDSFIGFLMLASASLLCALSVEALLGHDCFRRPDDDFDPSFCEKKKSKKKLQSVRVIIKGYFLNLPLLMRLVDRSYCGYSKRLVLVVPEIGM